MSTWDVMVLAGSVLSYLLMLGIHELRAVRRETRAVERHEIAMKALQHNRALTLAAVDQRSRLEFRADLIEAAIGDHADHLERLGRPGALRIPVAK
jgi:hypothetical protein